MIKMEKLTPQRVVIKEEYLKLLGNYKQAVILDTLIQYCKKKLGREEYNNFILEEQMREEKMREDLEHGWFRLSNKKLAQEILITDTYSTVRRWLKPILNKNYVFRGKDYNRAAVTNKYRINAVKLKKDLNEIGYPLKNFQFKIGVSTDV
jgi:hypothetical protein